MKRRKSGAGRKITGYLFKRGGFWWVQWQSKGKIFRRTTEETSKQKARDKAADIIAPFKALEERDRLAAIKDRLASAEAAAQVAVDLAGRIPLGEAWRRFPYVKSQPRNRGGAVRELSPMNVAQNRRDWEQFVSWMEERHKDAKAMQDVTPAIAQEYSDFLFNRRKVTAGRHNKLVTTCNVMYRLAGAPSPFSGVSKYQVKGHEHREPFAVEQVEKLLTTAEGEMRGLLAVLYFTGLRAGDAVQLRHENRIIVKKNGGPPVRKILLTTAKTGAEIDIIEHPLLTKLLAEVCGATSSGHLFPALAESYQRDPHLIIKRFNRLMDRALGDDFKRTEARRGRGVKAIARFGMHSFRHSLATHCAMAGVPIAIVQRWLGHASATITRIYQRIATEDQERVVRAIPALSIPGVEGNIIEADAVEVKALGPGTTPAPALNLPAVVELVKALTPKNVAKVKAQLLAALEGAGRV